MTYVDLSQNLKFQMYQWHKSGGVLLLLAFGVRLIWRILSVVPELPQSLIGLEKKAAKFGHFALYALMLLMPLSGWVMVSSSIYGLPTIVFGWFQWPHIPGLQGNELVETASRNIHFALAILFFLVIVTHILAVVKHAYIDKENLLTRIWWSKKRA